MTLEEMEAKLKTLLGPRRFHHSLGVRDTAATLARRFGGDEEKARCAGLLHDCAKNLGREKMLTECRRLHIALDPVERKNPALIHAPLGAELVKELFGVEDPEISDAIRYHTVGRAGMTLLEKVVYLADMIEPGREYPGVAEIRRAAEEDLDKAILLGIASTMACNLERGCLIHENTLRAWNDLIGGLEADG